MSKKIERVRICDALDLRSDDVIVALHESDNQPAWLKFPEQERFLSFGSVPHLLDCSPEQVDIIVCTYVVHMSRNLIRSLLKFQPRLLAFCPSSVDQERLFRLMMTGMYPFSEVWTVNTPFGKTLMTNAQGQEYDSEQVGYAGHDENRALA